MGGGCTQAWCVRWWGLVSVVRIRPGKVLMCVCVCVCVFLTCIWDWVSSQFLLLYESSIMHTDLLSRAWRVAGRRIIGDCTTPLVNITSLGRPPPRRRGRPATTYEHSPCYRRVMHTYVLASSSATYSTLSSSICNNYA